MVESGRWQLLMLLLTVYVLFAEDVKMATLPPSADPGFRGAAIFVFSIFVFELISFAALLKTVFSVASFSAGSRRCIEPAAGFPATAKCDRAGHGRSRASRSQWARAWAGWSGSCASRSVRALALERMRAARLQRRLSAVAAAEEAEAAALGVPVEALRAAQNASRRLKRSALAMSVDEWANEGEQPHTNSEDEVDTEVVGEDGRSAARRRRTAPTHGSTGMARASAVWERLNTAMSRKLIIGLLAVVIVLPSSRSIRKTTAQTCFSPLLSLGRWAAQASMPR
jgi:hypothetical protein